MGISTFPFLSAFRITLKAPELHTLILRHSSPWVLVFLHILEVEALTVLLFLTIFFSGYLYSKQPWKIEMMSSSRVKGKFAYSPV